ncbi:MAG: penicillin-binding transpeptidase domain-containing protein, partial [Calditrichia bacterium]
SRARFVVVTILICIGFALLFARLIQLQVVNASHYRQLARNNMENRLEVPARRGTIYDCKGEVLARDVMHYSVAVRDNRLSQNPAALKAVAKELNISSAGLKSRVRNNKRFLYLGHRVPADRAERLKQMNIPGLILDKRYQRTYPYKENGAHVVGFCNVDNQPLGGVEYQYNHYLQGRPGWKMYQRDAVGRQLLNPDINGEEPLNGFDVHLTIDIEYQMILEDELREAVVGHHATEGMAVLLDPRSGELLAMSNYPQFDPNLFDQYPAAGRKNRAVSDIIEPGSTIKVVPLSAALETMHMDLDKDIFFCENGRYRLYGSTVVDHKEYGWLSPRKIIEHSSNIGTMKMVEKMPPPVLFRYARNYGLGIPSGIDLPGESAGILHPVEDFSKTTHFYMSIGYEVGVTPLQLANLYGAIANGGSLMMPYVMKSIVNQRGETVEERKAQAVRQVISPQTAELIKQVLQGVVERGTGEQAQVEGLSVAGKTGTAQLYDPETGRYDNSSHLASFVGFFPVRQPQFVLLVMVRQPKGAYYGGQVAAPVFSRIARRVMSLSANTEIENIPVEPVDKNLEEMYIPRVVNLEKETAQRLLSERNIDVEFSGSGPVVGEQHEIRKEGRLVAVRLGLTSINKKSAAAPTMPVLTGLTLKETMAVLENYSLQLSIEGYGVVVSQWPTAGVKLQDNQNIKLVCKPL